MTIERRSNSKLMLILIKLKNLWNKHERDVKICLSDEYPNKMINLPLLSKNWIILMILSKNNKNRSTLSRSLTIQTLYSCSQLLIKYVQTDSHYKNRLNSKISNFISSSNQISIKTLKKESTMPLTSSLRNLNTRTKQS